MNDIIFVEIIQTKHDLIDDIWDMVFIKFLNLKKTFHKIASLRLFRNKVPVLFIFKNLLHLDNIGMEFLRKKADVQHQTLLIYIHSLDIWFLQNSHNTFFFSLVMSAIMGLIYCSSWDKFAKFVVLKEVKELELRNWKFVFLFGINHYRILRGLTKPLVTFWPSLVFCNWLIICQASFLRYVKFILKSFEQFQLIRCLLICPVRILWFFKLGML